MWDPSGKTGCMFAGRGMAVPVLNFPIGMTVH